MRWRANGKFSQRSHGIENSVNAIHPNIDQRFSRQAKSSQAKMPRPNVYEAEYDHWPWGKLLAVAADWVKTHVSKAGFVIDYMCGTGFLLNEIHKRRPDIVTVGCDICPSYIRYAKQKYPGVDFIESDALDYKPERSPNLIICTAGVHHLERRDQGQFIKKVSRELSPGGLLLIGEELIAPYARDEDRKRAVLEMFSALMAYIDKTVPPDDVVQAAADVMVNDWCERGEYKTSKPGLEILLNPYFTIVSAHQIWPEEDTTFGDWLFLCRKKSSAE